MLVHDVLKYFKLLLPVAQPQRLESWVLFTDHHGRPQKFFQWGQPWHFAYPI